MPNSNLIFIFGGYRGLFPFLIECNSQQSYFFNYENNRISDAKPMISNKTCARNIPVIFNNKIYCYLSGRYGGSELSIYDIESGNWSKNA